MKAALALALRVLAVAVTAAGLLVVTAGCIAILVAVASAYSGGILGAALEVVLVGMAVLPIGLFAGMLVLLIGQVLALPGRLLADDHARGPAWLEWFEDALTDAGDGFGEGGDGGE